MTASNQSRETFDTKFFPLGVSRLGYTVGVQNQSIAGREVGRGDCTGFAVEHSDREAGRAHGNNIMSLRLKQEGGIVATVYIAKGLGACIDVREHQRYIAVAVR